MSSRFLKSVRICLCGFICLIQTHSAFADVVQNRALIKKINARCISIDLSLAPVTTLHQLLEPIMPWDDFFNRYTTMHEADFKKTMSVANVIIQKATQVFDLEGRPFIFSNWKWPTNQSLLDTLKSEQILFITGSNNQGHAKPMDIHTQACSNHAIDTLQFSFNVNLYPLNVIAADDYQTVLTRQAPFATIEFLK